MLVGACGSSADKTSTPVTVFDMNSDPGKGLPTLKPGQHAVLAAAELRTSLDRMLTDHATLVAELVHEIGAGHENTTEAVKALAANSAALANAMTLVYGLDAGRAFSQLWEQHTQFFVDYAEAVRAHDDKSKEQTESALQDYQNDFGRFLSTATQGGVPLRMVIRLLHGHVHDLTAYIDADIAGRHDEAARLLDDAVAHMHVIAKSVTDSIIAQHLKTVKP
jgi:hypothetical protein